MLSIVLWQKGENWSYASQHLKKEPPDKKNCTFWYTSSQECKSRPSISWILALLKYKFCKFDKSDLRVFPPFAEKTTTAQQIPDGAGKSCFIPAFATYVLFIPNWCWLMGLPFDGMHHFAFWKMRIYMYLQFNKFYMFLYN